MADSKRTPPKAPYQAYPAKRYGANGTTCYVPDEAADKALGPGWHDHPSKVGKKAAKGGDKE